MTHFRLQSALLAGMIPRRADRALIFAALLLSLAWPCIGAAAEGTAPVATQMRPDATRIVFQASPRAAVDAVAWSPDGRWLLSASGKTVKLWDRATGKLVRLFDPGFSHVRLSVDAVAFSPDGKSIAAACTYSIPIGDSDSAYVQLWDLATGEREKATLAAGEGESIVSLAYSPDGRFLALADGYGSNVSLRTVATGDEVRSFKSGNTMLTTVAYAPDGATIAASGKDGVIEFWDAATGKLRRSLKAAGPVAALAFAPDGSTLISDSLDRGLELWDVASGRRIRALDQPPNVNAPGNERSRPHTVVFSPDGRSILTGNLGEGDTSLRVWDVASGKTLRTMDAPDAESWAAIFGPDGKTVLAGGRDGRLRLWNPATGALTTTLGRESDRIRKVAASPDGHYLAVSAGNWVRLWDLATGHLVRHWQAQAGVLDESVTFALAFSPDGRTLLTGGGETDLKLWSVPDAALIRAMPGGSEAGAAVAFLPRGGQILAGSSLATAGILQLDLATGKTLQEFPKLDAVNVSDIVVSPDGRTAASCDGYLIVLWSIPEAKLIWKVDGDTEYMINGMSRVAFSNDGKTIISSGPGLVRRWRAADGKALTNLRRDTADAVAFANGGQLLLSGGDQSELTLINTATGKPLQPPQPSDDGEITAVAFVGGAAEAVSASEDGSLQLWDLKHNRLAAKFLVSGEDWAVVTAEGTYTASGDLTMLATLVRGNEILPMTDMVTAGRRSTLDRLVPAGRP